MEAAENRIRELEKKNKRLMEQEEGSKKKIQELEDEAKKRSKETEHKNWFYAHAGPQGHHV